MIGSPNRVSIDLSALRQNLNQVRALIGRETKIMGIVKSDAYGHGLVPVSRALEEQNIHYLGVAHIHEALELRRGGIGCPIAILCGIHTREEAEAVVEEDLTAVIFDRAVAETLAGEARRRARRVRIQVKVDTGMGRLGIPYEDAGAFAGDIRSIGSLQLEALTSHLSSAEEAEHAFTDAQIGRFAGAIEAVRAGGWELPMNNLANSAGIMGYRGALFDMVRPGIMLYGGRPAPKFRSPAPLRPVMRFTGRVLQVREMPDHTPVSYGRTYYTKGRQRVAILSAGYGEGLPRDISNRGRVLIRGHKLKIAGTICMNMTMALVPHRVKVMPGDEAVFLGSQGKECITGDDVAAWGHTIAYEVFCAIGKRAERDGSK